MASKPYRNVIGLAACLTTSLALPAFAQSVRLKHLGSTTLPGVKHVMGVETLWGHYALISSYDLLCLVDLDDLAQGQSPGCIAAIPEMDATTAVIAGNGYAYVNRRQGGLAIVRLDEPTLSLSLVGEISEPGVFFEKMAVLNERLYVAAHGYGIRIYNLVDPAAPALGAVPGG